jgi:hypothetical protein
MNEIKRHGKVLCPSKLHHNCPDIGSNVSDKIKFVSNTKFSICPENSAYSQYWTEKIFQAFQGGTIPLYWAISKPFPDIIRPSTYVFFNSLSPTDISTQIQSVVENADNMLDDNRKNGLFTPQSNYVVSDIYQTLQYQIQYKLGRSSQKIYGISYASRNFQKRK